MSALRVMRLIGTAAMVVALGCGDDATGDEPDDEGTRDAAAGERFDASANDASTGVDAATALADAARPADAYVPPAVVVDSSVADGAAGDSAVGASTTDAGQPDDAGNDAGTDAGSVAPGCGTRELIAFDDAFLGVATSQSTQDSVCNMYGVYGNTTGTKSIFNQFSMYGSGYGQYSAWNEFATNPPKIICASSGEELAVVSKATLPGSRQRIDPEDLCATLKTKGW